MVMSLTARVQPNVVARRFHPIDLLGAKEEHAAAGFDDQAIRVALASAFTPQIFEQSKETRVDRFARLPHVPASTRKRLLESGFVEWLEQEVESVDLERFEGMVVVCGNEHDGWRLRVVAWRCFCVAPL